MTLSLSQQREQLTQQIAGLETQAADLDRRITQQDAREKQRAAAGAFKQARTLLAEAEMLDDEHRRGIAAQTQAECDSRRAAAVVAARLAEDCFLAAVKAALVDLRDNQNTPLCENAAGILSGVVGIDEIKLPAMYYRQFSHVLRDRVTTTRHALRRAREALGGL